MATMYKIKPIFVPDQVSELPTCMYRLKNLHGTPANTGFLRATNGPVTSKESECAGSNRTPEIAKLEAVQEDILLKLTNLKNKLEDLRKLVKEPAPSKATFKGQKIATTFSTTYTDFGKLADAAVTANPSNPPFGLLALRSIWSPEVDIAFSTHAHSTLRSTVPKSLNDLFNVSSNQQGVPLLSIRIIWADVKQAKIVTSPAYQIIQGEVNILRLLSRFGPQPTNIDNLSPEEGCTADTLLDSVHGGINGSSDFLNKLSPASNGWLLSQGPSIVDVALWSYFKGRKSVKTPSKLSAWLKNCEKVFS